MRLRRALALLLVLGLGLAPTARAAVGDWQPGPDAASDNTYQGFIDTPQPGSAISASQAFQISGWVLDTTAQGWAGIDAVQVYEGALGGGGTLLGQAAVGQSRPDVAQALGNPSGASSGFVLSVPAQTLGVGNHTLTVYAHAPDKGWWWSQVSFSITPVPPAPVNVIVSPRGLTISRAQSHYKIKGYALDPNATSGTGIDRIEVYMDEVRGAGEGKFLGLAVTGDDQPPAAEAYGARFMTSGYSVEFNPMKFDAGDHHIYAYAVSSITGMETLDVAGFNIADDCPRC